MKKLNRNPFNEKIIHRYLFDRLYFGEKKTKLSLLPQKYHSNKINLIVPEKKEREYRADLTIYFKEKQKGVPVEVKWNGKSSIGKNQIDYLKKNQGFIISFEELDIPKLDYIKIDYKDFTKWISLNISKLTHESLIYQADIKELVQGQQKWFVFLRGRAHDNWEKMLKSNSKKQFWAWRQNHKALRNIFDLQRGDQIVFVIGYATGEHQGISNNPKSTFEYSSWYLATIKEPYYMNLDDKNGNFFEEKDDLPLNKRKWPHFIDFEITEHYKGSRINYGKRGELSDNICESNNNGFGTPSLMSNRKFAGLMDNLRFQSNH